MDADFEELATDLDTLTAEDRAIETTRRSAVYKRLRAAQFEQTDAKKASMPERMCYRISLCPWVSEKLAAFAVWEARDLEASYRKKGKAFNSIGHVVKVTGTVLGDMGKPLAPSGAFEATWKSHSQIEAIRRARENQR